ncbi:MAG: hypothetical protein U1E28_22210 [Beijerinckiaceae bacterium]
MATNLRRVVLFVGLAMFGATPALETAWAQGRPAAQAEVARSSRAPRAKPNKALQNHTKFRRPQIGPADKSGGSGLRLTRSRKF